MFNRIPWIKLKKVLVSACLMGECVRYNGVIKTFKSHVLDSWHCRGQVVAVCPEVAGGLPVPRPRAEIVNGSGSLVLDGRASVTNINGQDVTRFFLAGAREALKLAGFHKIRLAVLKEGSPSCGSSYIYDGSFSGIKKPGKGVAAALLKENGIRVFNEFQIHEAEKFLKFL